MHLALAPGSRTSIQGASFCEETPADSPWLMSSFNHVFHFTPLNTVQSVHWYPDSDWLRDNWFSAQPFKMQIEQEYQNFDNWDAELSNEQLALNLNDAATLWSLTVTYWQWQHILSINYSMQCLAFRGWEASPAQNPSVSGLCVMYCQPCREVWLQKAWKFSMISRMYWAGSGRWGRGGGSR